MKGLRRFIAPFAPDQSGAVEVFCEYGGLIIVCDAGGCAGNICGFDEPRWFQKKSAIFSAGLRDMDAILGRDDRMVEKIVLATEKIESNFVAIIGTPVPSVIGTDYKALKRMIEKKTNLPVYAIDTNGTETYEAGGEKAYMEICREKKKAQTSETGEKILGVWGATPLDTSRLSLPSFAEEAGYDKTLVIGMGSTYEDLDLIPLITKNLVVSPAGLAPAKYLEKHLGIPYEVKYPLDWVCLPEDMEERDGDKKVLILHQQVLANEVRKQYFKNAHATVMSWFAMEDSLKEEGDRQIFEEDEWMEAVKDGGYDVIVADPIFKRAVPGYQGEYIDLIHFAVSGALYQ